jgi:hypothetical protein
MIDAVRKRWETLRDTLERDDLDRTGRVLRVAELGLHAAGVVPTVAIGHERIYELTTPPKPFRGLRDLVVRRGTEADIPGLVLLDPDVPRARIEARFARGDLAYVGELDGRLLAQSWYHRGPEAFDEDIWLYPRFAIPADTFWSYHAVALPEARASGVFVKVFYTALRAMFIEHGAARIRCRVKASNAMSVLMHERSGFKCLGELVAVAVSRARWMSWEGEGGSRRWFGRRGTDLVVALPP